MGSAGSQNPNWQRWIPKMVPLAQVLAGAGDPKNVVFQVPFPDSRLRVKISLLFIPDVGFEGVTPLADLWLYETDTDQSGRLGSDIPLTNIEGTSAVPTAVPLDAGLAGYSREFVSAADYVYGRFHVFSNGAKGYWVLQTRYQPQSVSFGREEWDLITAQCNPTSPKILVGS